MTLTDTCKTAYKGLTVSKGRSLLTILGIVIGITAIMLVMSLGAGAQQLILGQVESLGSKVIFVTGGRQEGGPPQLTESLKDRDLVELKKKTNLPNAVTIFPAVFGSVRLGYENEVYDGFVQGVTPEWEPVFSLKPSDGDFISDDDVKANAQIAILGYTVKEKLFGNQNPIGLKVKVKNQSFRVVGVLPEKGKLSLFGFDQSVLIPISTVQTTIIGSKSYNNFIVEADSDKNILSTAEDIKRTLRFTHNISDPDKDDFMVQPQADLANKIGAITTGFSLFLIAVAAISLVVGGVGIMNIMLVSVSERTREIGLRKALGATNKNILQQFLIEAILLTGVGGLVGILLGGVLSYAAANLIRSLAGLNWSFEFPISGMLIGLTVAVSIGLIFGIYPARQASKKSPTEALRYE